MTPRTRQRLLRYGLALDGVILATGVALLLPERWLVASLYCAAAVAVARKVPLAWQKWDAWRRDPARVKRRETRRRPVITIPRPELRYKVNLLTPRVTRNVSHRAAATIVVGPTRVERKPRLLLVERRRATADTAIPKLSQRGVEIEVVERWVDAVDELFRFKPDALFIDTEHPEAELIRRTIVKQSPRTPLIFTGTAENAPFSLQPFRWLSRPYDPAELEQVARDAVAHPPEVLAMP